MINVKNKLIVAMPNFMGDHSISLDFLNLKKFSSIFRNSVICNLNWASDRVSLKVYFELVENGRVYFE